MAPPHPSDLADAQMNKKTQHGMADQGTFPIWNRAFEVGVEFIDHEHKMIFSALKDFSITLEHDLGERLSAQVFLVLYNYTRSHFENEERFMRDIEYGHIDVHHIQHKNFLERLNDLRETFSNGHRIQDELSALFFEFLHNHVLVDDAKIAAKVKTLPPALSELGWLPNPLGRG